MSKPASQLPKIRPEEDDDAYTARLKVRLARDCLKLTDAGMFEHALVALFEIGKGQRVDGTPIPGIQPRTRASAMASFTRAVTSLVEKGTTINDNRTQILTAMDLVVHVGADEEESNDG